MNPRPAVIVTRPQPAAEGLVTRLQAAGFAAHRVSLLRIESTLPVADARAALAAEAGADLWIFTSVHAVAALGGEAWTTVKPEVAAIGAATAAQLAGIGIDAWIPQHGSRSEDLLADARLADLRGREVVLVGGEGGRGVLGPAMEARGARVSVLAFYRRRPVVPDPDALAEALAAPAVLHLTSAEAMTQWCAVAGDRAFQPDWWVVSPRLAEHARTLGFPRAPRVLAGPHDDDLVRALDAPSEDAMTEPETPTAPPSDAAAKPAAPAPAATPKPSAARERRAPRGSIGWAVLALLLLAALLVGGAWGYRLLQAQAAQITALDRALAATTALSAGLRDDQIDLTQNLRRANEQIALFDERLGRYDDTLGALNEQVSAGQERVQLAAVEHLLMIANDRLQLAGDVAAAQTALQLADARLARLADPRLFGVREAIAREQAALAALAVPDRAGIALKLAGWVEQAPSLPLKARVPAERPTSPDTSPALPAAGAADPMIPWYQRVWSRVSDVAAQMFVVRKDPGQAARLLPAEEEALIHGLLRLQLENARAAFLREDEASFQSLLAALRGWLAQYYALEQPAVAALDTGLRALQGVPLALTPPDISDSLLRLRAQMEPAPR